MEARLLLDIRATLGEGPLWSARDGCLYFVDIKQSTVHALNLDSGAHRHWQLPEWVGWVIEREQGGFVAGLTSGFALLELEPHLGVTPLYNPHPGQGDRRFNDAKATAAGQVFAGSMAIQQVDQPHGCLYRLDTDHKVQVMDSGYHICNGPAISPDQRTLYHTDSWRGSIYAYPLHEDGSLGPRQLWKQFALEEGSPDGMTVDSEGAVWVAHWGGGCVSRFAPDGRLLRRIALPVSQVTSVTFAGPGLNRLVATSARDGLSPGQLEREPLAGGLFELDAQGVVGLPASQFKG